MRFLVMVKATEQSEAGAEPSAEMLTEMGAFNETLIKDKMFVDAGGLLASSRGVRIRFADSKPAVMHGPFDRSKDLVSGFWLLRADSKEALVERMSHAPFEDADIEIRQLAEAEDLEPALIPELREQ